MCLRYAQFSASLVLKAVVNERIFVVLCQDISSDRVNFAHTAGM